MVYFYGRVSSKDQNLDRQLEAAKQFKEVDKIYTDKQSGKDFDRPSYQAMKEALVGGDEVIVKELDRLGRNKDLVKEEIKWFSDHDITLRILNIPTTLIDFQGQDWIKDMLNNILVEVLSSIAQEEREKIKQRQAEGIAAMQVVDGKRVSSKSGRAYGRPSKELVGFEKISEKVKKGELSVAEACRELGIGKSTYYRLEKRC